MKPLIAVTMGDPAGVGPELCLRILREPRVLNKCIPVVFGDADVLSRVAKACRLAPPSNVIPVKEWRKKQCVNRSTVVHCGAVDLSKVKPGKVQAVCGHASSLYIKEAVAAAMKGHVAAVATAPINKESLHLAGVPYPGHTEMLASLTSAKRVCMMMACDGMAVSLVTIHVPYSKVPELLSKKRIAEVIELTANAMSRIGRAKPRITVCALNPHAGENGLFGKEEQKIIRPAVEDACRKGFSVEGPLPPDTAFLPAKRAKTDAFVVMYHDQGLIPFKMLAFDRGVNITLGLPIVRTSVDHGTAFDIAWKGKASPESLIQSVLWALKLSGRSLKC